MVVGGHSITTPRDLYTAYSTNQGTVRVYIKCLITTYRGICDPWLLGEKVLFPPILYVQLQYWKIYLLHPVYDQIIRRDRQIDEPVYNFNFHKLSCIY